ncbi:hypothetical protein M5K25_002990 [Dendrobium thyrsiflorum]|uniref:Secreted protein n=1 Tax=Dendrobium thyrsiflorum TaxID=117978 RepID=A0ABD0VP07_DENTH
MLQFLARLHGGGLGACLQLLNLTNFKTSQQLHAYFMLGASALKGSHVNFFTKKSVNIDEQQAKVSKYYRSFWCQKPCAFPVP